MSMQNESNFYVYEHRTKDTNELFYIGKGRNCRATSKNGRNPFWKNIVNKHGFTHRVIESNLTEQQAFELEVAAIDFCRWAGARLANITSGGDGTSGLLWTPERREKMKKVQSTDEFKSLIAEKSKENWSNPEFKERTIAAIKKAHSKDAVRKESSERMLKVWQDAEYIEKNKIAQIESWKSEERKENQKKKMVEAWKNEDHRNKVVSILKSQLQTQEARMKRASSMLTPQAIANNRAAIARAFAEDPEKRKRQIEASRIAFQRPEVQEKTRMGQAKFLADKRAWVQKVGYIGNMNMVTKKMMELDVWPQ